MKNESGNALWIILLAVVLMAALTAMISRSSDTVEQSGNRERYRIEASDLMRHTSNIREAINKMRMTGLSESQVNFTSVGYTGSCMDCLVYGSAAGGVSFKGASPNWLELSNDGDPNFGKWMFLGTNNVAGGPNPDLIMALGYLKQGLCNEINNMMDTDGIPEDSDGFDDTVFDGAFAAAGVIDGMDGAETGCFEDGSTGYDFVFYQVLIKR